MNHNSDSLAASAAVAAPTAPPARGTARKRSLQQRLAFRAARMDEHQHHVVDGIFHVVGDHPGGLLGEVLR